MYDEDQLTHNLTNHPPTSDEVIDQFEAIREAAKTLGIAIIQNAPDSREKALALTNLEQSVMWAIAAVARNQ